MNKHMNQQQRERGEIKKARTRKKAFRDNRGRKPVGEIASQASSER